MKKPPYMRPNIYRGFGIFENPPVRKRIKI
jgi:hypothetical protein